MNEDTTYYKCEGCGQYFSDKKEYDKHIKNCDTSKQTRLMKVV